MTWLFLLMLAHAGQVDVQLQVDKGKASAEQLASAERAIAKVAARCVTLDQSAEATGTFEVTSKDRAVDLTGSRLSDRQLTCVRSALIAKPWLPDVKGKVAGSVTLSWSDDRTACDAGHGPSCLAIATRAREQLDRACASGGGEACRLLGERLAQPLDPERFDRIDHMCLGDECDLPSKRQIRLRVAPRALEFLGDATRGLLSTPSYACARACEGDPAAAVWLRAQVVKLLEGVGGDPTLVLLPLADTPAVTVSWALRTARPDLTPTDDIVLEWLP
jgi:hypothetical protein